MDKETVDKARVEAEGAYEVYCKTLQAYEEASIDWLHKKRRFQDYDHQLAMTDGRLKVVPPAGEKREKKPATLTLEQIQNIADILGIKIEEDDNAEEV